MIALSRLAFQAEALGEVSFQGAMRNFYTSIGLECCAMERLLRKVDCHFLFDALFPIDKHPWLFGYEAWSRKGESSQSSKRTFSPESCQRLAWRRGEVN